MAKTLWERYGSSKRGPRTVARYGTVKGKQTGAATVAPKTSEKDQNRGGLLGGIGYAWAKSGLATIGLVENVVETGLGALFNNQVLATSTGLGLAKLFGADDFIEKMQESTWVDYDAADKWYNPSEEWKNIGRAASVDKYLVTKVLEGATQTLEGVDDYITGGLASLAGAAGIDGAEDYAKDKFDSDWIRYGQADEWFDPEGGWKIAGDVASGIGTSVPAIAANFIPAVGPAVSIAISGFGAAGNATKEAYRETGKLGAAEYGYGALVGGTEALIEGVSNKIGVGTGDLAKTIVGKMGGKAVKSTAKAATQATVGGIAKRIGKDFLSEAAEEGIAEIMDPLYRNLLNEKGEGVTWDVNWGDVGYAALVGGMTGALMGGAAVPIERSSSIKTAENVIADGKLNSVLSAAELVADSERTYQTGYGKFRQTQGLYDQLRSSLDTTGGEVTTKQQKIMLGELTQSLAVATQMPAIEKSATKLLLHAEESASVASEQLAPVAEQMGLVDADGKPVTLTAESIIGDIDMSLYDSRKRSDRKLFAQQVRQAIGTNPILTALAVADAYADVATGTGNADADVDVNEAGSPHTSSAETGGMTSGAASIEDFARDTGIVAETGAGLTQGAENVLGAQMGVQKENAAGGVFEGQAEATAEDTIRKVARERGLSESETRAMTEAYKLDGTSELDAQEYAERFAMVAKMGRDGAVESKIDADEYLSKLPESSRRVAYKAGQSANVQKENASAGAGAKASIDHNAEKKGFKEDKYFKSQMRKWDSLKHGSYVKVGELGTQHPLCMVGMPAGTLRYDVDKLKRNMSDHADYLTTALLEEIPKIIAEPMAISQFSEENTVSVFGNIFVGDSPMMVGVTISKDRAGNDISKVRTYNARRDVGGLLTDESVLYLGEDKKRTLQWFQACGIQVPLGGTKFGFIRSISQNYKKSNTISKKTSNSREESADHEQTVRIRDGGQRDGGTDPRGEVSRVEGGAEPNQARGQAQRRARDPDAASLTYGGKVSTALLGITGGTDSPTVRLVESGETAAMKEAKRMAEERGLTVTFFSGTLQVRQSKRDKRVVQARALIEGDRVYIRVDHDTYTADKLMKHEVGHDMIAKGEVDVNRVRRRLAQRYGKKNLKKVADEYAEAYAMTDMTAEEIWEEVICDSLADMNAFAPEETLEALNQEMVEMIKSETEASRKEARGPPRGVNTVNFSFGATQEKVDQYVENAYAKQNIEDYLPYSVVDQKLIDDVSSEIDITGYAHALRDNDIRHIRNSHGESTNEKYPVTKEDLAQIPYIVSHYDKVFVKTNANAKPGLVYVKVGSNNVVYYVEAVTTEYHNKKLLVNKQMVKAGFDSIPNLHGLIAAINKKESSAQYLADLQEIREAYVQDVKGNYSIDSIAQNSDLSTESAKKDSGKIGKTSRETLSDADTDVNENEAEGASPSPTEVETEVQNEAVARVEKAEAAAEKELKAENAKLREDVEHLKELLKLQRTVTDGTTFTKASMSRAASRIMKVIGATKGKTQLLEQISQLYAEIATAEQVDMEDIMSRAEEIAEELIDEQPGTRVPGDPEYAEILDYLRSTSFSLTDVQKQEAAYRYGSYESFRRRMMGKLKIKKNAASLDVIWGELCELYPGIFSTEMNEADMVEAIVQIRHDAVINQTAFAYIDKDAAISDVARTIYDGYWDAVPVHTLADEHRREVSLLKAKHARVTEEIRASADRRVAAMRESLKEQNRRVREQRDEAVRKERERADARIEGWRERRQETKDRHAVRRATSRLYKRLLSPTKERNVPESLRAAVAESMLALNMDSKVIDQIADIEAEIEKLEKQDAPNLDKIAKLESKLYKLEEQAATLGEQSEALLKAYEAASREDGSPLAEEIVEKLRELQGEIGNAGIYDMDHKQLRAARDFYDKILHQVTNANKWFDTKRQTTLEKIGRSSMTEMHDAKVPSFLKPRAGEAKAMVSLRKYMWQMLKPIYAVEMMGSDTFSQAFAGLHRGEGVCSADLAEAQAKFQQEADTYHFWDWDRTTRREFATSNGKTVKLTLGQMMSLYAYSKRENAHQHLREGGFTFAPDATYKGKLTERMLQDSERYTLTEVEFGKIANALTEEQRAFADAMQDYLSKDMAAKGNEVSLELYDIKLFGEENYWPMRSAKEYLDSETGKTGDPKIKNKGFTKKVAPGAGNPLVLSDFMETWNGHVGEMALYHGLTLPMENMNRLLNYRPGADMSQAEAALDGKSDGNASTETSSIDKYSSMKELIREKYGYEAVTYIEQLLRDLNGGVRSGVPMDLIDKGISLFKKSAVMASASVVIQQPSSIARAWAMINPKYFANTKGLDFKNSRENYEELKKYAPIAIVKEMGGFDTGVGQATSDYIMERDYKGAEKLGAFFKDKAYRDHVFGYAASKADQMAWLQLWEACKREQAELHPDMAADSDEVMKLAGERFTDIVTHTQVYDSTLSRSAMMRSKDTTWKMATAFMAEPTTVFNMLMMGTVKLQRGDAKAFRGIVGSVVAATILNAVLASLVYAARDDDEDKSYGEKYVSALIEETADSFNPLTMLPIVKDIWSLVQGYNVERTDMAVIADLIDAVNKMKFDENTTGEEIAEKWINLAVSFSSVFGLPLRNLQRDARAIGNVISNKNKSTWSGVGYAARESVVKQIPFGKLFGVSVNVSDGQQLYEAAVTGNDKQYARVKARFESETAARTALRTALRDNDPRIEEAARARVDADTATYARLVREIVAEGYFTQTDVVAAVNSEYNAMVRDIESGVEDNADPDAGDEAIASIYKSADLNAELDAGDWQQAKVIIDDMVAAKIASGKSQKQARAAIKSGVTSYWKPLYLEAYASRNSAELRRIRVLLIRTRLYGTASEVAETVAGWVRDEAKKKAEAKKIARQGG